MALVHIFHMRQGTLEEGGLVKHTPSRGRKSPVLIRVIKGFEKINKKWYIRFNPVHAGAPNTEIQVNTLLNYKQYSYRAADTPLWICFKTNIDDACAADQKVASNPCSEIELPSRKSCMTVTAPATAGKYFSDFPYGKLEEYAKAYGMSDHRMDTLQFAQEYQAAFIDKEATLTVSSTGRTKMNRGNLENPINNVRYTEVNGTKITEMSDRQLIGAINNFNNEITQLDKVPVESKAINKQIKRLEKAIKRCVKELDAR